ncbi:MAG: leucine--tRNA ligase, partial [Nanoarchaeota archaeon]|nr:leucine--tRNA ligase [Nanoarchaeota archaeon]
MNFKNIEQKWQKKWDQAKIFNVEEDPKKKKFYVLEMFPYPSGSGLHMGHAFNYTIGDIYARFKRKQGYHVLYPMGYDSFGLPAENAAIKNKSHPKLFTETAIKNFIEQQKALGLSYDWNRMIKTSDPSYYQWNQYLFLQLYKKGLVYRKAASVNWCPECNTVLANEQVHQGNCWRHTETPVHIKNLEQWFIKTTNYAEELLNAIETLDWPERIKIMQRNWIGKSEGTEITFTINNQPYTIFTTRSDTLYGVTFLVISPQHPQLQQLITKEQQKKVEEFINQLTSTKQADLDKQEKIGIFTGSYAIHPLTQEKIPVWVGNFVLADYGSGIIMAVPAHDQRDYEFAKKYQLPIKQVIIEETKKEKNMSAAYTEEGTLINSGPFNKLSSIEAQQKIVEHLQKKNIGKKTVHYKLKDWLVSRQRYWGTPIPIIYCKDCGIQPVPEEQLPILLPEDIVFGEGNPLMTSKTFQNVTCPTCKKPARRETDTMDTFFDSSWYYLRYCDPHNTQKPFDKKKTNHWMPVDIYIGGAEHACMHLIYARFFTKALRDLGYLTINEPFPKLFNQGMLHGEDGYVMSKSRGNVVLPETIATTHGIDTARFFLMSIASPDKDTAWNDQGIASVHKLINKIIDYYHTVKQGTTTPTTESKLHNTIKKVTHHLENMTYNLALIELRQLFLSLQTEENKTTLDLFLQLLNPFCPHITEELWEQLGNKPYLATTPWPSYKETKINPLYEEQEHYQEKVREDIRNILQLVTTTPKEIHLYLSPEKKYPLYQALNKEKSKDLKQLMQTYKHYGPETIKTIQQFIKGNLRLYHLTREQEEEALNNIKKTLTEEFKTTIMI